MKYILAVISLCTLSFLIGCDNNDDDLVEVGTLNVTFEAYYGDDPLYMYNGVDGEVAYEDGMNFLLQLFQFYISDITLMLDESFNSDGNIVSDVELISFKDVLSQQAAEEGVTFTFPEAPVGIYSGLRFGLGVEASLNAQGPEDFSADHPLSGHYWGPSSGYVFYKIEGNADTLGTGDFDTKLTYHVGGNEFYSNLAFLTNLVVTKEQAAELTIRVDLKKVLVDPATGEFLDFRLVPIDHTVDENVYGFLDKNFKEAFSFKQ